MKEGYRKHYSDEDLKHLLEKAPTSEQNLYEDRLIKINPNNDEKFQGACLNWELAGKGYRLYKPQKPGRKMTNEELLTDAYRRAAEYEAKRKK
jgi:hypothetical protein